MLARSSISLILRYADEVTEMGYSDTVCPNAAQYSLLPSLTIGRHPHIRVNRRTESCETHTPDCGGLRPGFGS